MPPPTPHQQRARDRVEGLIGLAVPFLDLILSVGERVSRIAGPEDDYVPVRAAGQRLELGAGRPEAE